MIKRIVSLFLGIVCLGAPGLARTPEGARPSRTRYDPAREMVVKGTVQEVRLVSPSRGRRGAYLVLRTASGRLDVHLGLPGLVTRQQLAYTPGEAVEVVGVPAQGEILLAREVRRATGVVTYRTARGMPQLLLGRRR